MNRCHGLTGGIGSGKSTVADMFAALGVRIVDTDHIAHQLTQSGGSALPLIRKTFGAGVINDEGAMDRKRMRQLVFADPAARQHLEATLHPLILAEARRLASLPTEAPYTLVVVPLLFESKRYRDWLDRVVVVDCTPQQQIERTIRRSGLDEAEVRAIMGQQISREERLQQADEIIVNGGQISDLLRQVETLHAKLMLA